MTGNLTFNGLGVTTPGGAGLATFNIAAGTTTTFNAGSNSGSAAYVNAGTIDFSPIAGAPSAGSIAGTGNFKIGGCSLPYRL